MRVILRVLRLYDWIHDLFCPCRYVDYAEMAAAHKERQMAGCSCGDPLCGYKELSIDWKCDECGEEHWRARCRRCWERMCDTAPHFRFYCPKCGEVVCGTKRQGQWIVRPHYRHVAGEGPFNTKPCVGGNVDPKEDRAP